MPVFAFHGTGRLWAELNDSVKYIPQGSKIEGYEDCFSAKSSSKSFRNWYKTLEKNIDKKDSIITTKAENNSGEKTKLLVENNQTSMSDIDMKVKKAIQLKNGNN